MKTHFVIAVAALLLAACGQTGPLRLPGPQDAPKATTQPPGNDSAADKPKTAPKP